MARHDLIINNINQDVSFSDAINTNSWEPKGLQLALLSFKSKTINYVCLAEKRARVVTGKSRIDFFEFIKISDINTDDILNKLNSSVRHHFSETVSLNVARFPEKTWEEVILAIKELTKFNSDEIDRLISLKKFSGYQFSGRVSELLLLERDALGGAFDIFNKSNELRKRILRTWAPKEETVNTINEEAKTAEIFSDSYDHDFYPSFLEGLSGQYVQEESAIQHDLMNFPDYEFSGHKTGVSKFEQGGRSLNVFYANRNKLEHTLGVDLIYFKKEFNAFTLVQYKLMQQKNDAHGYYYRPDDQLHLEHNRMKSIWSKMSVLKDSKLKSHSEYRLLENPFLYKLVPNKGVRAGIAELVPGMFLSHEYMDFLIGPEGPKGPRGGNIIGYENSPRYLTNTEFVSLVDKGFIGTKFEQSAMLHKFIKSFLEGDNAIVFAIEGAEDSPLLDKSRLDNERYS